MLGFSPAANFPKADFAIELTKMPSFFIGHVFKNNLKIGPFSIFFKFGVQRVFDKGAVATPFKFFSNRHKKVTLRPCEYDLTKNDQKYKG